MSKLKMLSSFYRTSLGKKNILYTGPKHGYGIDEVKGISQHGWSWENLGCYINFIATYSLDLNTPYQVQQDTVMGSIRELSRNW